MNSNPPKVIHPFFISIFPILSLYACNLSEVVLKYLIAPLAIVLITCIILWLILRRLTTNKYRAGFILTGFWFYFFAYSNYHSSFNKLDIEMLSILPSWLYFVVWTLMFATGVYFVYRIRSGLLNITHILNVIAVTLIVMSTANITLFEIKTAKQREIIFLNRDISISTENVHRPNIFYIILDQHVRGDVLRDYFDYDNDYFYEQLKEQGFWIAQNSHTNYVVTQLSLASSLNFHYLNDISERSGSQHLNAAMLEKMMKHSETARLFKQVGYDTVSFSSGFHYSEFRDADLYCDAEKRLPLSNFTVELINNTPIRYLFGKALAKRMPTYHSHRRHILNTLDKIPDVMQNDKPVFVFAHILCPHQPYVFDSHGSIAIEDEIFTWSRSVNVPKDKRAVAYLSQLEYIDRRIVQVVKKIKQNSPSPPVIIIQSDHGVLWASGRGKKPGVSKYKPYAAILNTYHLPGFDYTTLNDTMSPVNTFRVIFNHYFGMDFELLKDKSYYSSYTNPSDFTDITEELSPVSTSTNAR